MKPETIKMLKVLKKCFKNNIAAARQNRDWLDEGQWDNMLFAISKIEEYEEMKFD